MGVGSLVQGKMTEGVQLLGDLVLEADPREVACEIQQDLEFSDLHANDGELCYCAHQGPTVFVSLLSTQLERLAMPAENPAAICKAMFSPGLTEGLTFGTNSGGAGK